jgi:hypothetical protein
MRRSCRGVCMSVYVSDVFVGRCFESSKVGKRRGDVYKQQCTSSDDPSGE